MHAVIRKEDFTKEALEDGVWKALCAVSTHPVKFHKDVSELRIEKATVTEVDY